MKKQHIYYMVSILIPAIAGVCLVYHMLRYPDYDSLLSLPRQWTAASWLCMVLALLLMPLNILLEALKWQTLNQHIARFSLSQSVRQVCYGIMTGFITPYRIGDYPGRVLCYRQQAEGREQDSSARLAAEMIAMGALGSVILTLVIIVSVLPWGLLLIPVVALLLPRFYRRITARQLYLATFQSLVRYLIWCIQMVLVLWAFLPGEPFAWSRLQDLFLHVVAYYAAVTITPSIPVGDPVIRSSWAMLIFGDNTAADLRFALVAVCIWAINTLIPMLCNIKVIKNLHN